jgi:hypothetical protein
MDAIVITTGTEEENQASAEACQNAVDAAMGLPVEGVDTGGGVHVPAGDQQRFTKYYSLLIAHPTRTSERAYPYDETNGPVFDTVKAAAVAAGAGGTDEQKLIAATPTADGAASPTTLGDSWFPEPV